MFVWATLTLGDFLVSIAYTQKSRKNVDADIHVSSGDRGLNFTASLSSRFILYSDEPWSRRGVVDKTLALPCKPGVAGSIPGSSSLSDETLSCGPVSI